MAELGTKEWWANLASLYVFVIILAFVPAFDRLYRGQIVWFIVKLVTFGGFYIWWFIDLVRYVHRFGKTGQWVLSPLELAPTPTH